MLEIILVVLALIAIVGASIYFYIEMKDHKATNNTDFEKVTKNIEEEEKTRLGNIKYVVDQVNDTNKAMDEEYMAEIAKLKEFDTGFGKLIQASGSNITIGEPGGDISKIKLMKDVSVIGSMSIKDLEIAARTTSSTTPSFKACGGAKCIEFPNSTGDTYLVGITGDGSSVVSGSKFKANEGAEIMRVLKTDTINNLTEAPLTISTGTTGNTISIDNVTANGITLTSGVHSIEIKNDSINIKKTDGDPVIKFNNKTLTPVTLTAAAPDLAVNTVVLTLVSPP